MSTMKYAHDEENQPNLLENLEALSRRSPVYDGDLGAVLGEEDDTWMLLENHHRIDIEVECWGRRLA